MIISCDRQRSGSEEQGASLPESSVWQANHVGLQLPRQVFDF